MKDAATLEQRLLEREDAAAFTAVPGREFAFRPGTIVVAAADLHMVESALADVGAKPTSTELKGVVTFTVPSDVDVPALVDSLRASDGDRSPRVGPAHLVFGAMRWRGCPGDDPEVADPLGDPPEGKGLPGEGVTIAVIDTGLDAEAAQSPWLAAVQADAPDDIDLTVDQHPADGFLDAQAGHAAFIAGIIRQHAPGARIRVIKALDTDGVGDELSIARAIDRASGADIVNLSLGGYTAGDLPPVAIVEAINRLPRSTAVVAAAGNLGHDRPMWPAALKRVISVGAIDEAGERAEFTNFGWWVDACAPGVEVRSVYVTGQEHPAQDDDGSAETFDGFATWSGSSFSCARVSAAIAVEKARSGGSARQAANRLIESASIEVPEVGVLVA